MLVVGVDRFMDDIESMIGFRPTNYWKIMWRFVTPATTLSIWLVSLSFLTPVTLGNYEYPLWAVIVGWIIGLFSLVPIPVLMVYGIFRENGGILQRIMKLVYPEDEMRRSAPEEVMYHAQTQEITVV